MPIVDQSVFWGYTWTHDYEYTATWEVNISPARAMAKTSLFLFNPLSDDTVARALIVRYKTRLADGSDYQLNTWGPTIWHNSLSSVTFGLEVGHAAAGWIGEVDSWGA